VTIDLQKALGVATEAARGAGKVLLRFYEQPHEEATKSNIYDIVTEGDKASEALIVSVLRETFPDHHIVGEEGSSTGAPAQQAEYFWYVDPLDGTSNFANNIPLFSISIALADRHKKPLVGVVYAPVYNELYTAVTGQGAALNGKPIRVSQRESLSSAILVSGFPSDKEAVHNNLAEWAAFNFRTRGLRRLGSAAIDLGWVAAGRFDGYWERDLHPWDVLAGILCVQEAGGKATDYAGRVSEWLYGAKEVLVSNGRIHDEMLALLAEVHGDGAH
jgi:myo-inositol-1(or 4)-monophosphatase